MIEELLTEFRKNRDVNKFVNYFLKDTEQLPVLIDYSMNGRHSKLAEYGSWLCNHIAEKEPYFFLELTPQIIELLNTSTNQSLLRNWLRMLLIIKPGPEHDGHLFDIALNFIQNPQNKVALAAFSMTLITPILIRQPELIPEVLEIIELHSEGKSAAFHSSFRTLRRKIKKVN